MQIGLTLSIEEALWLLQAMELEWRSSGVVIDLNVVLLEPDQLLEYEAGMVLGARGKAVFEETDELLEEIDEGIRVLKGAEAEKVLVGGLVLEPDCLICDVVDTT
uniref:Uncharacterized protein n=1 Tax=Ditylenchus dipsaci TaxID=166011 RepID=A0A915CTK9_9BILA